MRLTETISEKYEFFNPNHDPKTGRFASGPGGASGGKTTKSKKSSKEAGKVKKGARGKKTKIVAEQGYDIGPEPAPTKGQKALSVAAKVALSLAVAYGAHRAWKGAMYQMGTHLGPIAGHSAISEIEWTGAGYSTTNSPGILPDDGPTKPVGHFKEKMYKEFGGEAGLTKVPTVEHIESLLDVRTSKKPVGDMFSETAVHVLRSIPVGHLDGIESIRMGNPRKHEFWDRSLPDVVRNPDLFHGERAAQARFSNPNPHNLRQFKYATTVAVFEPRTKTIYIQDRPFTAKIEAQAKKNKATKKPPVTEKADDDKGTQAAKKSVADLEQGKEVAPNVEIKDGIPHVYLDRRNTTHHLLTSVGHHVWDRLPDSEKINWYGMFRDADPGSMPSLTGSVDARTFFAESYAFYVTQPVSLNDKNDKTYEYMRDNIFFGRQYAYFGDET